MNNTLSSSISLCLLSALLSLNCSLHQPTQDPENRRGPNGIHTRGVISRPDLKPLVESEANSRGVKAILATSDIGIGENRISLLLTSPRGFVNVPVVTVTPVFISETLDRQVGRPIIAPFRPWPYGERGLYVTTIHFDKSGTWVLDVTLTESRETSMVSVPVDVHTPTHAPMNGDMAIESNSRTLADVRDIKELTTGSLRDPELYQISIEDAILSSTPTVVVFASPAFCLNAVCGPQVEVLQKLKDTYEKAASFIHVDFYDNPKEIQGDLTSAVISPIVREWGLPSSEWTFIIDQQGRVFKRFEGFANYGELAEDLTNILSAN